MLIRAATKQGDITCDYFIKVESLCNITTKLIFKYSEHVKDKQMEEKDKKLEAKDKQLDEALEHNSCLHTINIELLTLKKLLSRDESIYIVSTLSYAQQGFFKIGRTKNIKSRNSDHNVAHVNGDRVKVLAEFKVNNAASTESLIHSTLEGARPTKNSEFFMCPYNVLHKYIYNIVNFNHNNEGDANQIIDLIYNLKQHKFTSSDWTEGISMDSFNENIKIVETGSNGPEELAKFDTTNATEEEKQAFVRECIAAYNRTINPPAEQVQNAVITIIWTAFQGFLIRRLLSPKSKFKPTDWKKYVEVEEKKNKQLAITWRVSKKNISA